MTAAIVVNHRLAQAGAKGRAAQWQARSPEELRNLTALAQAAVGFDGARGDLVTVEDLAFDENRPAEPVSLPSAALATAESSPVLVKYAALLTGLLVVVAFGLRPALRQARSGPQVSQKELNAHAAATQPALSAMEPIEADPDRLKTQEIFEQVTGHLKREPTQSSRLLQSWIHSD
jgi:flagellar M-ring protein FliF